jgi:predicted secreted protein
MFTFRQLAAACLLLPTPLLAQEFKPHPWDPRQQDRTSSLEGYRELRQLVTTESSQNLERR